MDIMEGISEIFIGLVIFAIGAVVIMNSVIDPEFEQIEINYNARADKAATFTTSINEGLGVHDQAVGRTPGVDPDSGYTTKDSGSSRMYFRPEQFVMLPAVDTDVSSNPNTALYTRTNAISEVSITDTKTNAGTEDRLGVAIGKDNFLFVNSYKIDSDSLYDKQITYDSITNPTIFQTVSNLTVNPSLLFGNQSSKSKQKFGGFNITLDSTIHEISGKKSNSLIFLSGRMPAK